MLSLYVYDSSRRGLRDFKISLKKIKKETQLDFIISTMTRSSTTMLNRIKPSHGNLFLLPYIACKEAFILGELVRASDPRATIVYWIQEPVDYLKIIQSNIEILDVLDKKEEDFYNKLKNIIIWTQIRIKEDSYSALS